MTTFIKTKFEKSDDQTNIDIYRVAANIDSTILTCIKHCYAFYTVPKCIINHSEFENY